MDFFSGFGTVQSCIVNHDKRHAFLKLISHQDAHATKQAVDMLPNVEYRGMFERVSSLSLISRIFTKMHTDRLGRRFWANSFRRLPARHKRASDQRSH